MSKWMSAMIQYARERNNPQAKDNYIDEQIKELKNQIALLETKIIAIEKNRIQPKK